MCWNRSKPADTFFNQSGETPKKLVAWLSRVLLDSSTLLWLVVECDYNGFRSDHWSYIFVNSHKKSISYKGLFSLTIGEEYTNSHLPALLRYSTPHQLDQGTLQSQLCKKLIKTQYSQNTV